MTCERRIVDLNKTGKGIISLKVFNGYVVGKSKLQNLFFRYGTTHLNFSLKKLGETFNLRKDFLKTEIMYEEVLANTWRDKIDEWIDYVKNDVLCTAFSDARFSKAMEDITGFGMKHC